MIETRQEPLLTITDIDGDQLMISEHGPNMWTATVEQEDGHRMVLLSLTDINALIDVLTVIRDSKESHRAAQ